MSKLMLYVLYSYSEFGTSDTQWSVDILLILWLDVRLYGHLEG